MKLSTAQVRAPDSRSSSFWFKSGVGFFVWLGFGFFFCFALVFFKENEIQIILQHRVA